MKRMILILGALAAFQAAAITATKEYVDRRDNDVATNRYTKAETDARIVELAPVPGNYETVSNRAMTALQQHQDISGKADKADTYTKAQTDARIAELAPVPDVQGAIGAFAATGTVHQAETASYATDANQANVAKEAQVADQLGDSETGDLRTAAQIFAKIDAATTTNDVRNIVTNEVSVWSEWTVTPSVVDYDDVYVEWNDIGIEKGWYYIIHGDRYFSGSTDPNASNLSYDYDGTTITASRQRITRNALGLARLTDIPSTNGLATKVYVDESIAAAGGDTTYHRTIGVTNLNQSVQYVNITDTAPTTLAISMPTNGVTKDWMVYVLSVTNVTLSLPAATWWMADAAYTNEVPPATPTAFWFSQITDGIFILGRQELTELATP